MALTNRGEAVTVTKLLTALSMLLGADLYLVTLAAMKVDPANAGALGGGIFAVSAALAAIMVAILMKVYDSD